MSPTRTCPIFFFKSSLNFFNYIWRWLLFPTKNYRHDSISWQSHLGLLQQRFDRRNQTFRQLLDLRCAMVNSCFDHESETAEKFVRISVEQHQTLLWSDQLLANAATNSRMTFSNATELCDMPLLPISEWPILYHEFFQLFLVNRQDSGFRNIQHHSSLCSHNEIQ